MFAYPYFIRCNNVLGKTYDTNFIKVIVRIRENTDQNCHMFSL